MSFCRIISTLCSQIVFHNVPHFSRRRQKSGKKIQRKIAAAVQKVKSPVLFIPLFWNQRHKLSTIILFVLVIKLTYRRRDGGFREGGIRDGKIGDGEIERGGCEYTFLWLSLIWDTCRFTVPPAVPLLNYISCGILWRIFLPNWDISRGFSLNNIIKYFAV